MLKNNNNQMIEIGGYFSPTELAMSSERNIFHFSLEAGYRVRLLSNVSKKYRKMNFRGQVDVGSGIYKSNIRLNVPTMRKIYFKSGILYNQADAHSLFSDFGANQTTVSYVNASKVKSMSLTMGLVKTRLSQIKIESNLFEEKSYSFFSDFSLEAVYAPVLIGLVSRDNQLVSTSFIDVRRFGFRTRIETKIPEITNRFKNVYSLEFAILQGLENRMVFLKVAYGIGLSKK